MLAKSNQLHQDKEVGFVISAQDYLIYLVGLPKIRVNDLIISQSGGRALVTGLDKERIEALMLDRQRPYPGSQFEIFQKGLSMPLKSKIFGRILSPLGAALDGGGGFPPNDEVPIDLEFIAPGIEARKIISEQLITGCTVVDTLLPIGKGQRELLFGEPRSEKRTFLADVIINQKGRNIICIYVAMGRSEIDISRFVASLAAHDALDYTIILAATSSDAAPLIAISPAVACAISEFFAHQGKDVLLILDDLGIHAKYLREISLLSGRVPGRESYPADIFYAHSHLVERAGNFNEKYGNASITLLPVIETDLENFTNLIPTNVMSMTDGHILFSSSLRSQGYYPAIEPDRSVTRVGHQTQTKIHKILSDAVRSILANYHELERYSRFGAELTAETQLVIKRGIMTTELLKQEPFNPVEPKIQILLLTLLFTSFFLNRDVEFLKKNKQTIATTLAENEVFQKIGKDYLQGDDLPILIKALEQNLPRLEEVCHS